MRADKGEGFLVGLVGFSLKVKVKVKVRAGLTFMLRLGAIAQWLVHEASCCIKQG